MFLPREFHGQRSLVGYSPWGSQRVGHNWATEHTLSIKHRGNYYLHFQRNKLYNLLAPQLPHRHCNLLLDWHNLTCIYIVALTHCIEKFLGFHSTCFWNRACFFYCFLVLSSQETGAGKLSDLLIIRQACGQEWWFMVKNTTIKIQEFFGLEQCPQSLTAAFYSYKYKHTCIVLLTTGISTCKTHEISFNIQNKPIVSTHKTHKRTNDSSDITNNAKRHAFV